MAKPKFDGVIESVRFKKNGKIAYVRAYERRGATFSDWVLIDRPTLVERLKAGKKYVTGRRVPYLASTFEVSQPVRLIQKNGTEIIVTSDADANQDQLPGVPFF